MDRLLESLLTMKMSWNWSQSQEKQRKTFSIDRGLFPFGSSMGKKFFGSLPIGLSLGKKYLVRSYLNP